MLAIHPAGRYSTTQPQLTVSLAGAVGSCGCIINVPFTTNGRSTATRWPSASACGTRGRNLPERRHTLSIGAPASSACIARSCAATEYARPSSVRTIVVARWREMPPMMSWTALIVSLIGRAPIMVRPNSLLILLNAAAPTSWMRSVINARIACNCWVSTLGSTPVICTPPAAIASSSVLMPNCHA